MKINLAKSAGFCFGVKRAIDIAFQTADAGKKVYMLGDIVHNEDVVREINAAGIKKIKKLSAGGKGKILLIRAHGASQNTLERAGKLHYKIIDATCPMVKEIHSIARGFESKGYKIIVIGDKKHDEVRGIIGQLKNKAIVIETLKDIPIDKLKRITKACVVVQSTQNLDKVAEIVTSLKHHIKELKFFNTICRPTRMKQEEIKRIPLGNDVMIIIGSKTSANTRRLYEISKSINKRSFWIQSKLDLRPEWFRDTESAGVTAGASTPDNTTQEVISRIKEISCR